MLNINLRDGRLFHYIGALAARGLEAAGKFGLYTLAARMMGGTEFGLFFLCLTWVNLCSTLARMGLERAMSRHIAAEMAVGRGALARQVLVNGLGWTALSSSAAAGVTFLLSGPLAVVVFRQPELAHPLALAALVLPAQTMAFALGFALIGLNRGVAGQMVQSALPPVLSLIGLVAGFNHIDELLTAYAASYGVCCILGLGFIVRDWHRVMVNRFVAEAASANSLPSLWHTAMPFLVIEMVQVSLLSTPVLVLGAVADAAVISAFSIVSWLTMLINTILVSIAMIAAPAFTSHHRRNEYAALARVKRTTRTMAMAVCLPAIGGMIVFVHPLLSLMGTDVPGTGLALSILAVGQVVNTLLPTQDMILSMTGHGAVLRRLNLQQLVVCGVFSLLLIPAFGMLGAALVSTICLVQGRISFALAVRRVLPLLSAQTSLTINGTRSNQA